MDGRRFGVGLAVGLFFGLAVVTLSGGFGPSVSPPGLFSNVQRGLPTVASNTSTASTSVTTSVSHSNTSYVPGNLSLNSNLSSLAGKTTTTSPPPKDVFATNGAASSVTPQLSSHLASIAQQPLLANTVVLVPVILAFVLGVLLYSGSRRDRKETDRE